MILVIGLHCGNERHFVLGAASSFASGVLATKVGVVNFDPAGQLGSDFAFAHDLHEFVLHPPGRRVADTNQAAEFQARHVVFVLGQQVHGLEPNGQRKLR